MVPLMLIGVSLVAIILSSRKKNILAGGTSMSEPPEFEQIRSQIKSDYKFYLDSVSQQDNQSLRCGNTSLTADSYCGNPTSRTTVGDTEIQKLSNAVEWAAKCARTGGYCKTSKITSGISDDSIIETVKNILTAVIVYRYPQATAEQQADIYIRTVKETVVDVKNLHWLKIMPYVAIAIAAVTAGFALVGTPAVIGANGAITGGTGWAGTGTLIGTIGSTVGTTIPAGLSIAGGVSALTTTPKDEKEAKKQLTEVFASLKVIIK